MSWYVDGAGAARALINGIAGLTGKGNPLANGVHLARPRSAHNGAVASVAEIPPRRTDDIADNVRLSFEIKAPGSEPGARAVAEGAARALLNVLTEPVTWPVIVTTQRGDVVRVLWAFDPEGPTWSGDLGGESTYRVDVTLRCQPVEH